MKIAVMGAGAVGGYFGGLLAKGGQDVTFIARGEHLTTIQGKVLKVESVAAGDFSVQAPSMERPDGSWKADLVLFCVKTYHNAEAIQTIAPLVGDQTAVLALQNGVANVEELARTFGEQKVLAGAAYIESHIRAPGVVAQTGGPCRIVLGEPKGGVTARTRIISETFRQAGINAEPSPNVLKELWNKFIFICALSGMTSITRSSLGEVLAFPETHDLLLRVMKEAASVGLARGIDLDEDVVERTMAHFDEFHSQLRSSMQLDLERGNRLEVSALNGTVVRLGTELGVDTPVNSFIYACLKPADDRAKARLSKAT